MSIFGNLFGNDGWEKVEKLPHWVYEASQRDEWEGVGKIYRGKHFMYQQKQGEYNPMHGTSSGGKWYKKSR